MSNSPILGLTLMSASQAQKEVVFNNFLIAMDALFRGSVLDTTLSDAARLAQSRRRLCHRRRGQRRVVGRRPLRDLLFQRLAVRDAAGEAAHVQRRPERLFHFPGSADRLDGRPADSRCRCSTT